MNNNIENPTQKQLDKSNSEIAEIAGTTLPEEFPETDFPIKALGSLSSLVLILHETVQAPLTLCVQSVLSAVNLAAQAHADVRVDSIHGVLSLLLVSIARSGERKTALDGIVLKPHRMICSKLHNQYKKEKARYDHEMIQHAKNQKDGAIWKEPPTPPLYPILIHSDFTTEGLMRSLAIGYPSQGCFTSEGGTFTAGYGMQKEQRLKTAAAISGLWDGIEQTQTRAGSGIQSIRGKRVCAHIMLQPNIGTEFMLDGQLTGQGLLARVLAVFPPSRIGMRKYNDTDIYSTEEFRHYEKNILNLYELALPISDQANGELEPKILRLSPEAKVSWRAFHELVESKCIDGGSYEDIVEFACKASTMALRIAGTLSLYENPSSLEIDEQTIERALQLMDFYLMERLRLVATEGNNSLNARVRRLWEFISNWSKNQISSEQLLQLGPSFSRKRKSLDLYLDVLESHGLIEPIKFHSGKAILWEIGGRESSAITANPLTDSAKLQE